MALTPAQLLARLEALGIEATTHRHPAVFTVEEARRHCGHLPGQHCKNLFLKDRKDRLWLIVARDEAAIELKTLDKRIGSARLSFGRADLLMEVLGVTPGAVTPFALANDTALSVTVVLDEAMMRAGLVNFHPLTNEATSALTPAALLKFLRATGHEPRIMALDRDAA